MINKKIIKSTPFGSVCIVWRESDSHPLITNIILSRSNLPSEDDVAMIFPDCRKSSCTEIDTIADSIKAYLAGENVKFSLGSLDFGFCSPFQKSVLRAQYAIPRGRVSTYGLIAAHVGVPDGARAVGNVMAANPFPLIVPCHRTILSDLRLGGFQSGAALKRALLEKEGIIFDKKGRVVCRNLHYDKVR
jgi:methylated-DNA-[protein]-cysteine S-methyltransferase